MSVKVNSTLEPRVSGYTLVDDSDVAGGLHIVEDEAAMDLIPDYNRKLGMLVYAQAEGGYWKLIQMEPTLEWEAFTVPQLAVYSNGTRPDPSSVSAGTLIFNTSDNTLNVSDGTNWRDMIGTIT